MLVYVAKFIYFLHKEKSNKLKIIQQTQNITTNIEWWVWIAW